MGIHVQLEPAVRVHVGPERRGQGPPVGVGEPLLPLTAVGAESDHGQPASALTGSRRRPGPPRMLVRRLRPLGPPLPHRRFLDSELRGQVLDHRSRRVQWVIREEPTEVAQRAACTSGGRSELVERRRAIRPRSTSGKKNRSSSERVGSSANFPYASACSPVGNSAGTSGPEPAPGTRPAVFPRTPAEPPVGVLANHDQCQRQPMYRGPPRLFMKRGTPPHSAPKGRARTGLGDGMLSRVRSRLRRPFRGLRDAPAQSPRRRAARALD